MLEPLNDSEWRVFRLLIRDLPDRELEAIGEQLQREMVHRQECDSSWARLLFTSLSAVDLQRADAEIRYQRSERVEILQMLEEQSRRQRRAGSRQKVRRNSKPQRAR